MHNPQKKSQIPESIIQKQKKPKTRNPKYKLHKISNASPNPKINKYKIQVPTTTIQHPESKSQNAKSQKFKNPNNLTCKHQKKQKPTSKIQIQKSNIKNQTIQNRKSNIQKYKIKNTKYEIRNPNSKIPLIQKSKIQIPKSQNPKIQN